MCEGVYHGLYRLENRGGQYYWSHISYGHYSHIYRGTHPQLNIESDRESSAVHETGQCLGNFILFKEEDLAQGVE